MQRLSGSCKVIELVRGRAGIQFRSFYSVSVKVVKQLETNCEDWLNDKRQVRNNNLSEGE